MVKRFVCLFITLIITVSVYAQLEVKENSFKEVPGFVNINTDKMYDDNDKPYAVLKIKTENIGGKERRELSFKGDAQTFFEIEYKDGEVWIYISYYATLIKISHEEFSSTEFYFPFDMKPKCGYELTLVNKSEAISSGWASLILTTSPENGAEITLNGREIDQTTPYTNNMLPSGKYDITVSKFGFESVTKTIVIDNGQTTDLNIEMPYIYYTINVESTPSEATVSIDDVECGKTPITLNNIKYGAHELKVKKENYSVYKERFVINGQGFLKFNVIINRFPDGSVKGIFSVSNSKKVYFSKGNLQYQPFTNVWRFAEYQWNKIGYVHGDVSVSYKGWMDLFGWGTGNDPLNASVRIKDNSSFTDWGRNAISNGDDVNWRTLTKDEWVYLFDNRNTISGILYAKAIVNGVEGVILLPDDWSELNYKLDDFNNPKAKFKSNIISKKNWTNKFETNGAVFLPGAGYRTGSSLDNYSNDGYYWSATLFPSLPNPYCLHFTDWSIDPKNTSIDFYSYSVRLVCDVE